MTQMKYKWNFYTEIKYIAYIQMSMRVDIYPSN